MIYHIFKFEDTNLWRCISANGSLVDFSTRKNCIAAATHDAMMRNCKCTIKCEVIKPAKVIIEHLSKII